MVTTGVLGGRWRATVSPAGTVEPWDGSPPLHWYVAADDRWHTPEDEPTVRQRRIDATPVVETRVKVPNGDAVQRVWSVPDGGGCTIVEIENDSSLPFAVAFDRPDLVAAREPANVPIQGIDLPAGSVVFPVGHRSTVRLALAHDGVAAGSIRLDSLAPPLQVARGWTAILDRAGRLLLPDDALVEQVGALRSELALGGPALPADDAIGFLIDVAQLVRLGEQAEPWVPDVADAVAAAAREADSWDRAAALDAAAVVMARAGEDRALRDLARLGTLAASLPPLAPAGRVLVWNERRLAQPRSDGTADLLSLGMPATWLGANFEVHGLPIGPSSTVSFAVRWHGDRPAVLWETTGPIVPLTASFLAPEWSTAERSGEALWPAPAGAPPIDSTGDISFS